MIVKRNNNKKKKKRIVDRYMTRDMYTIIKRRMEKEKC